jgi:hypothetical protein
MFTSEPIINLILVLLACCGLGIATRAFFNMLYLTTGRRIRLLVSQPFYCGYCWAFWWSVAAGVSFYHIHDMAWIALTVIGLVSLVYRLSMIVFYLIDPDLASSMSMPPPAPTQQPPLPSPSEPGG